MRRIPRLPISPELSWIHSHTNLVKIILVMTFFDQSPVIALAVTGSQQLKRKLT